MGKGLPSTEETEHWTGLIMQNNHRATNSLNFLQVGSANRNPYTDREKPG